MTSASIDSNVHLLRGVVPQAVGEPAQSRFKSAFPTQITRFRRLLSKELGCPHDRLVFDDINDVHCDHCGKDFTG
jgi:hypothetical protein